jgi:hypothetical protein
MATFNYSKYITYISDKIDYYGGYVNYYYKIDPAINSIDSVTTYSNIVTPVKVVVTNFSQLYIDGTNVQKDDKLVLLKSTLGRPKVGDNIVINSIVYRVVSVSDIAPNVDDTLLYKIQVRSYNVTTEVDNLVVRLGDVAPGSIVTDPYAINDLFTPPEWLILAHGHHKLDTTTLVTNRIHRFYSFDGTFEGGGYFPDTPWKSCFMRSYLNNTYLTYLTANLRALLITVSIETQTDFWNDTISLLSKEELFNIECVSSSGSFIPYFSSNALRIGRWINDDLSMRYWTRDVYSWEAPVGVISVVTDTGASGTYSDASRAGVRPIIFLSDDTELVLNPDGKYSINY